MLALLALLLLYLCFHIRFAASRLKPAYSEEYFWESLCEYFDDSIDLAVIASQLVVRLHNHFGKKPPLLESVNLRMITKGIVVQAFF
jgi:hypothetical protein